MAEKKSSCRGCKKAIPHALGEHPWCGACRAQAAAKPLVIVRRPGRKAYARRPRRPRNPPQFTPGQDGRCGRCRAKLGARNDSGFCCRCRVRCVCKICCAVTGGGVCRACGLVLERIAEKNVGDGSFRQDSHQKPPWLEQRIALYATRRAKREPLFQ